MGCKYRPWAAAAASVAAVALAFVLAFGAEAFLSRSAWNDWRNAVFFPAAANVPETPSQRKGFPGLETAPVTTPAAEAPVAGPVATPAADTEREKAIRGLRSLNLEPDGPALAGAVREDNAFSLDLLLKAGVTPSACDIEGKPALLIACELGRAAMVRQLLQAGANPNAAAPDGKTAAMAAASQKDLSMLKSLVDYGADVDPADAQGHTALAYAVLAKEIPAVQWLLEQGALAGGPCCGGQKTLEAHALESGNLALFEPVLRALKPAHWSREARTMLYAAVRREDKTLIRVLLGNHGDPPTPEGFRQPLLGYAIAWGQSAVVALLLECGADPNTPLSSPVEAAFAKLIPQKVTRFYLENEKGMTPLMLAAGTGRLDCVEMLLHYGAKRGAVTRKSKFAAISFAARAKSPEIMQVLLGKSPRPEDQRVWIEISLGAQVARLWKDNQVVMAVPISTGRRGFATPSGRFVVTDKERNRTSTIYNVKMPYFMRLNCSEVGMHAGVVPNYPASHGCIRLPREAAIRFYREADVGTLVTIR